MKKYKGFMKKNHKITTVQNKPLKKYENIVKIKVMSKRNTLNYNTMIRK